MNIDHLLRPDLPEARSPEWTHGLVMGCIPAILTDIETGDGVDSEGLGRIKIKCDLISEVAELPNSFDGMVWVLEDFVSNEKAGGAHRLLEVGSQVILLPIMGNLQQLIMIGCIHSRADRPNPLFDRSVGVHGTQTSNNVYSIRDDLNSSRTDAYPNGVTQQVSASGDVIAQTQDHARLHLQKDGGTRLENDVATIATTKDGTITQRSAGGAITQLGKDGEAIVKSTAFDSELRLDKGQSTLSGPASPIAALIRQAQSALGGLFGAGASDGILGQLQGVLQRLQAGGSGLDLQDISLELGESLSSLQELVEPVEEGLQAISKLQEFPIEELGNLLMPQLANLTGLNLHQVIAPLEEVLGEAASGIGERINLNAINQVLEQAGLSRVSERIGATLGRLGHDLNQQVQLILGDALEDLGLDGYDGIANLAGMGLHRNLGDLQDAFRHKVSLRKNNQFVAGGAEAGQAIPTEIEHDSPIIEQLANAQLQAALPKGLQEGFDAKDWNGSFEQGMQQTMGKATHRHLAQTKQVVDSTSPLRGSIPLLEQVVQAVQAGNLDEVLPTLGNRLQQLLPDLPNLEALQSDIPALLQTAIAPLVNDLTPLLNQGIEAFNQVMQDIPSNLPRAVVRANAATSELRSALGTNRVFANDTGAGLKTPQGSFSFGAGGGLMETLAPIAMRVGQQVLGEAGATALRSVAGLSMSQESGVSLEGYTQAGEVAAKVQTVGNQVSIQASGHSIEVSANGVIIDGWKLDDLLDLPSRFIDLESRLTARINAIESQPAQPAQPASVPPPAP